MIKIAIVDTSDTIPKTTTNVHLTNCFIIKDYLDKQNIETHVFVSSDKTPSNNDFDVVLLSYGSKYFDFKKWGNFIERQKNAVTGWITNDYNLEPNSSLVKYVTFVITNHDKSKQKTWTKKEQLFCNLNSLVTFDNKVEYKKKYNCIYYGTFRAGRESYFESYFKGRSVVVSTSAKNMKKFINLGCASSFLNKLNWEKGRETLGLFKYSLYIEDKSTHEWFSHLANRFYECLSMRVLPIIDKNCRSSFEKSIFDINDFPIISSYEDIEKINLAENRIEEIIEKNIRIALNEKRETLEKITAFVQKIVKDKKE